MTLYRFIRLLFIVLALALLWAITHPESGIAPSSPPATIDTPSAWLHIQTPTHPPVHWVRWDTH